MRVRLCHLGAPIVTVRTDGDVLVSVDSQIPAPRAEEMIAAQFPGEDPHLLHRLVTEAYLPPLSPDGIPVPRQT